MRKVFLDTNAYVRYLTGDEEVLSSMGRADRVVMSVFVLGELYAGFRSGSKGRRNRELLETFLQKPSVEVLAATRETAEIFGQIKTELKRSGNPIPINDVWIAAHALEIGGVLITYDRHFQSVPGIRLWESVRE
jgi:tRNA(fMet)-specific endonuclease VapC